MKSKSGIASLFEIAYVDFFAGDTSTLAIGGDESYITTFLFVVPLEPAEIKLGLFDFSYKGCGARVEFWEVVDKKSDLLFQRGKDWYFGNSLSSQFPKYSKLPFEIFTDNRGRYPCIYAFLQIRRRIANWFDPDAHASHKVPDRDRAAVVGWPLDEDKVSALLALNDFLRSADYEISVLPIEYEDITVFLTSYCRMPDAEHPVLERFTALASGHAFDDAVCEYLLGKRSSDFLGDAGTMASELSGFTIDTERDLLNVVVAAIQRIIKHNVENRRWIEPFWDERKIIRHDGKQIRVKPTPKPELKIQPTLFVLLHLALNSLGIQVVRESHEGAGELDFRCLYTTRRRRAISVPIEFKLAHHGELKKGIRLQLPAYMRATGSLVGIFLVMWFKGKAFKRPARLDISSMNKWLVDQAKNLSESEGLEIVPIVVDASQTVSASNQKG